MNSRKVFGTVICAILVLAASSAIALGQVDSAAYRLVSADADAEDAAPSSAGMAVAKSDCDGSCNGGCYQSSCCPRWTATADYIIFDRIGTKTQTLIRGIPLDTQGFTGRELLNSNDFHQGFHGGPRVSLIRHGDRCFDLELLYFQIDGWDSARHRTPNQDLGPNDPREALVFSVPGLPLIRSTIDPMEFDYGSKLYNAEFNARWNPTCRITLLAGFRWAELRENLSGGLLTPNFVSFWNTNTKNDLYGFQIGTDTKLWECGCFSIDGLAKAGVYNNHAEQTSRLRIVEYVGTASTNHVAFLGEVGLQGKYQVTCNLTLRAGYEVLWLDGVALAPAQINNVDSIDAKGTALYHGATAGFEYSF